MPRTKFLLFAFLAVMLFALTACAAHRAGFVVYTPPPPPPHGAVAMGVAPGPGFVWVDGYYAWNNRWTWMPGRWVRPPHRNSRWVAGYWAPQGRGYVWRPGYWRR